MEVKVRKTRSDKKRDVKPTVPLQLKECIDRLSYITNLPIKDISVEACEYGLNNRKVIELLSNDFRRDFRFFSTIFIGDASRPSRQREQIEGMKTRISMRFKQETYERLYNLSFALDVTPTRAAALLLDATLKNSEFIDWFLQKNVVGQLDKDRQKELKVLLKYINKHNPYNKEITLSALIAYYFDEVSSSLSTFKEFIERLTDK